MKAASDSFIAECLTHGTHFRQSLYLTCISSSNFQFELNRTDAFWQRNVSLTVSLTIIKIIFFQKSLFATKYMARHRRPFVHVIRFSCQRAKTYFRRQWNLFTTKVISSSKHTSSSHVDPNFRNVIWRFDLGWPLSWTCFPQEATFVFTIQWRGILSLQLIPDSPSSRSGSVRSKRKSWDRVADSKSPNSLNPRGAPNSRFLKEKEKSVRVGVGNNSFVFLSIRFL